MQLVLVDHYYFYFIISLLLVLHGYMYKVLDSFEKKLQHVSRIKIIIFNNFKYEYNTSHVFINMNILLLIIVTLIIHFYES